MRARPVRLTTLSDEARAVHIEQRSARQLRNRLALQARRRAAQQCVRCGDPLTVTSTERYPHIARCKDCRRWRAEIVVRFHQRHPGRRSKKAA